MKGFIIKDLLFLKSYSKTLLLVLFGFGVMSLTTTNFSVAFFIPFIAVMISITTFNYDDFNKWDAYAISLPVSRKQIVAAKYLFTLLTVLASALIGALLSLLIIALKGTDFLWQEFSFEMLVSTGAILVVLAIIYPFIYKYGAEKGRMFFFLMMFVGSIAFGGIALLLQNITISFPQDVIHFFQQMLPYVAPILVLVTLYCSYLISCHVYLKKEF